MFITPLILDPALSIYETKYQVQRIPDPRQGDLRTQNLRVLLYNPDRVLQHGVGTGGHGQPGQAACPTPLLMSGNTRTPRHS